MDQESNAEAQTVRHLEKNTRQKNLYKLWVAKISYTEHKKPKSFKN